MRWCVTLSSGLLVPVASIHKQKAIGEVLVVGFITISVITLGPAILEYQLGEESSVYFLIGGREMSCTFFWLLMMMESVLYICRHGSDETSSFSHIGFRGLLYKNTHEIHQQGIVYEHPLPNRRILHNLLSERDSSKYSDPLFFMLKWFSLLSFVCSGALRNQLSDENPATAGVYQIIAGGQQKKKR